MPKSFSYVRDSKVLRIPIEIKNQLDNAKPDGIELWKFGSDVILLGLRTFELLKKQKNLQGLANYKVAEELMSSVDSVVKTSAKK